MADSPAPSLNMPIKVVGPDKILGLRQHWVAAGNSEIEAELGSGAGLGSPFLTLVVRRNGKTIAQETIDIQGPLQVWIDDAIARSDA